MMRPSFGQRVGHIVTAVFGAALAALGGFLIWAPFVGNFAQETGGLFSVSPFVFGLFFLWPGISIARFAARHARE
jgi:hypothetical protein